MAESPALNDVDETVKLASQARDPVGWPVSLLGASTSIARVRRWLGGLAPLRTPVLLTGEAGSGRLEAAGWLHRAGTMPESAFQVIDARTSRGPTTLPIRGTLLLQGLEHLAEEGQRAWMARLVAGTGELRFVATAGPGFEEEVGSGRFDARMAAEFSRFELALPALRDRREDLPTLVDAHARIASLEFGRPEPAFTPGALRRLGQEAWPGNLAELCRVVERLAAFCASGDITAADVDAVVEETRPRVDDLRRRQQHAERESLLRHLHETGGNVAQTAQRMGRSRPSIYRLVEKYGIALR